MLIKFSFIHSKSSIRGIIVNPIPNSSNLHHKTCMATVMRITTEIMEVKG